MNDQYAVIFLSVLGLVYLCNLIFDFVNYVLDILESE